MRLTLGLGLPPGGGGGAAFSPLSLALFEAMEVEPDDDRMAAIDAFIKALVGAGVWDLLDVLYVYAAHDDQASLLNWKNPAMFEGTIVDAPVFTEDRGWDTDSGSGYISTGFEPSAAGGNFAQNSACFGGRSLTAGAVGDQDVRTSSGAPFGIFGFRRANDSAAPIYLNTPDDGGFNTAPGVFEHDGTGLYMANRSASDAVQFYHAGILRNSGTNASSGIAAGVFHAPNVECRRTLASFYAGASLDETEQAALDAIELAYMQAVGAVA